MISLLELELDRPLSINEMSQLKNAIVVERNSIKVEIKIIGTGKSEILSQSHFSLDSNPWKLYIVQNLLIDQRSIYAEAINNLFASIIGRELKRVEIDIKNMLSSPDINAYLESYNISLERVIEIRNFLESKTLNNKQQFYLNLIKLRKVSFDSKYFPEQEIAHKEIANLLSIEIRSLIEFDSSFDFNNVSNSENIHHLESLFKQLGSTLSEFNMYSTLKIYFVQFHMEKLNQLKNKLEQKFINWLHNYLKNKDIDEQLKFQSIIDMYKDFDNFKVDPNWLIVNYKDEFDKWIQSQFPNLKATATVLNGFDYDTDVIQQYKINKNKFINAIKHANISSVFLDEYLAKIGRASCRERV